MKILFACLLLAFTLVRSEISNCRCSVILVADGGSIVVAYDDELLATVHENCYDEQGCAHRCHDALVNGTNGGDLNHKPVELGGLSVGDYGCMLFGVDVKEGHGFANSRLCNHGWVNSNFTFNGAFCCVDGKHTKNAEHCG